MLSTERLDLKCGCKSAHVQCFFTEYVFDGLIYKDCCVMGSSPVCKKKGDTRDGGELMHFDLPQYLGMLLKVIENDKLRALFFDA